MWDQLRQANQHYGDHALVEYRRGQCLSDIGMDAEALIAFQRARDLDGCRFRAPAVFGDIVRDIVRESGHSLFLDIADRVEAWSSPAAPGADLFLEHVHYNARGHRLLASWLAEFIQTQCLQRHWATERVPDDEALDRLLGVLPEDELTALIVSIELLQSRMFSTAADARVQSELLGTQITEVWDSIPEARQYIFSRLSQEQIQNDLIGALIAGHRSIRNASFADELKQYRNIRQPWLTP